MSGSTVFVGRQPILDRNQKLFAYELLYRNSNSNKFPNINPEQATISLLVTTFMSIGVDRVANGHLSFINFSAKLLMKDFYLTLDPKKVVIEILEDVEITPALLRRLRKFKKRGFKLALDDFILQDQYLLYRELFTIVDIIKVDFSLISDSEHRRIQKFLRKYPHLSLLAEKIEDEEQFHKALKSGYSLFQGYFFAKPEIIKSAEIPTNTLLYFEIIKELNSSMPDIDVITNLIKRDVSLSYKMLRYINTLAFEVPMKISSIKQAIILIGLTEAKRWMQVLLMLNMDNEFDGRTQALVNFSLIRAKLCELLAIETREKNVDEYFMAGMFSQIDILMRRDIQIILPLLSLSEIVTNTLSGVETAMTPYIQLVEALERFEWDRVDKLREELAISEERLSQLSIQANRWAQII